MLKKLSREEFDDFYELLCVSFPNNERRNRSGQLALFDDEKYSVYARSEGAEPDGILAVWEFDDFLYIEHFAVNPKKRNGGVGSGMLSELSQLAGKRMCLEVELPEGEMPKRRIAFYERNGFTLNGYDYIQPSMGEGKEPLPLLIMTTGGELDRDGFENIKNTLYKYVYKVLN